MLTIVRCADVFAGQHIYKQDLASLSSTYLYVVQINYISEKAKSIQNEEVHPN